MRGSFFFFFSIKAVFSFFSIYFEQGRKVWFHVVCPPWGVEKVFMALVGNYLYDKRHWQQATPHKGLCIVHWEISSRACYLYHMLCDIVLCRRNALGCVV